jgi:superfamily I DNA/RNA helicase
VNFGRPNIASRDQILHLLEHEAKGVEGHKFSMHFLLSELEQIVDAWQLETWEAYRDVTRLGRKTRLPEQRRLVLWTICEMVRSSLAERIREGVAPREIGAFVRSEAQLDRARSAVEKSKIPYKILDDHIKTTSGHLSIGTMHIAKGLEFRAVAVMACGDEIIPHQERIETVADDSDLEEVYNTERHLLYVACTRPRDHLLVTSGSTPSEFLEDMRMSAEGFGPIMVIPSLPRGSV